MDDSRVLLSGFSDEAAADKTPDQQFSVMAALGLRHVSLRFVDCGRGVRNILDLEPAERQQLRNRLDDYGLAVSSIGSPIGKIRIADIEDGSGNRYVPFPEYLDQDLRRAVEAAEDLDCRLIRGFSFYHPRGSDPEDWFNASVERLGQIAGICDRHGLTFGLEVEANLIGHTGDRLARIHEAVSSPALVLVFDGGNLVTQGMGRDQVRAQFHAMLPGLGWMHVKDYRGPSNHRQGWIDEEQLAHFVPADCGEAGHRTLFEDLKPRLAELTGRLQQRGIPGFFVDLEPHLKGGGQFGGYSGADGMGIACRALCHVLDQAGISSDRATWSQPGAKK